MSKKMFPADIVIERWGVRGLARALKVTPSCVSKWRSRGGSIPDQYKQSIIDLSDGEITIEELCFGRAA